MKYKFGGIFKREEVTETQLFLQLLKMGNGAIVLRLTDEDGCDLGGRILTFKDLGGGKISKCRDRYMSPELCEIVGWEQDENEAVIFD